MRKIFIFIIIIGLGLTGLAYYAEVLSLATLAQVPIDSSAPASPDSQAGFLRDNLERISLLVRIIRYAGIFVLVLAMLGLRRSGKSG